MINLEHTKYAIKFMVYLKVLRQVIQSELSQVDVEQQYRIYLNLLRYVYK